MHYRSFKFVSKHKFTAKTVSLITGRDNVNNHHRRPKPWLTQLMLMALITLPQQSNAADLATSDQATQAQRAVVFNIPRQAADDSLPVFGQQADVTVIYPFEWVKDHHTNRLQGEYSVTHAVAILLDNTGLQAQFSPEGHLVITQVDETKGKNMNTNKRKTVLATMVGLFAAGGMSAAMAQESMGESARPQNVLDEIIITAQKREQNLQDVGLAVTALNSDALNARGVDSPYDLQFSVPGLTLGNTVIGAAQVTLRGVGMENIFLGGDPGVPMHVDGHYLQSTAYMLQDFLDIERVEVLRGPQGTLYGRNAIGGSINIITKRPTDQFEGLITVNAGNYNKRLLQTVLSGPISDALRGRLVVSDEKRDGYVENVSDLGGEDLDSSDYTSIRGSLEFDLGDNVSALLSGYHYKNKGKTVSARWDFDYPTTFGAGFINYYDSNAAGTNITATDPGKVRVNQIDGDNISTAEGGSIDIDWDLGGVILRSLTAYNQNRHADTVDLDNSDVVTAHQFDDSSDEIFTQEFQLLSDGANDIKWIVGLFYYDEKGRFREEFDWDNLFVNDGTKFIAEVGRDVEAKSTAVFGQLDYSITQSAEVIFGLRYTEDEKAFVYSQLFPDFGLITVDGGPVLTPGTDDWAETSGKLGLNYHLDDNTMLYISFSTGYKSGGFNATAPSYDPETVDAYEAGLKGTWNDQRVQANLSAFYYDYTDKQEFKRDPGLGFAAITNAGAATIWGVELETKANLMDGLLIDLSAAYLNAEYDEFDTQDGLNRDLGVQDLSGNSVSRSPEWKVHLGVEYAWLLGERGSIVARIDTSWVDEQYSSPFNRRDRDFIPSYSRTNAQLRWDSVDELWQATAYIRNLEDKDVIVNRFDATTLQGIPAPFSTQYAPPRTFGVSLTRHF